MKRVVLTGALLALAATGPSLAASGETNPLTETVHVVKPGETLGGIANRSGVARILIVEANALAAPYAIKAGQKLLIPRRRNHSVKPGETGFSIAMNYGVPWATIAAANGLASKAAVKPGQVLTIPTLVASKPAALATPAQAALAQTTSAKGIPAKAARTLKAPVASAALANPKPASAGATPAQTAPAQTAPTQAAPTQATVAKSAAVRPPLTARPPAAAPIAKPPARPAASAPRPYAAPAAAPPAGLASGSVTRLPQDTLAPRMIWPLRGEIRRNFAPRGDSGGRPYHDGIDIAAAQGAPVRAAAEGKVIFAGQGPKEYGLTVIIYHSGRWTTTYASLDRISVKDGDKVRKGQQLGLTGQTGMAIAPQLHFEVRRNRVAQDPVGYLPDLPETAL